MAMGVLHGWAIIQSSKYLPKYSIAGMYPHLNKNLATPITPPTRSLISWLLLTFPIMMWGLFSQILKGGDKLAVTLHRSGKTGPLFRINSETKFMFTSKM